jgi:hypothetical protein
MIKKNPKLVLNKLKVMENSTFIYIYWVPNLKKFIHKFSTHMWFMFANVHPCANYE